MRLLHSSATKMDLEDASFDMVTSTQTLEYIPDVDAALSECTRILKSYGEFLNISILWDHFRFYGAEEKLNEKIHDAFRAHCSHQMLPMELLIIMMLQDLEIKKLLLVGITECL